MIYLIHKHNRVIELLDKDFETIDFDTSKSIANSIYSIAQDFPDELIIWCHEDLKLVINKDALFDIFHHKGVLASYSVNNQYYIPDSIGYVDQYIYIKVNRNVTYPTWLMSSDIGGLHAGVINKVLKGIKKDDNFEYFLNSISKIAMPQGLFCYSDPRLLLDRKETLNKRQASSMQLFKFVKHHYKTSWIFFLFLSLIIYEKRFPLFAFLNSIRFKKRNVDLDFDQINIHSKKNLVNKKEVDVVIPTLGRKKFLYDVLNDLSRQTLLPKNVIIVEQNPLSDSESELDYLTNQEWPFNIKHIFIHQLGVCNARNIALEKVESEWTFLGDDDIRFNQSLLEDALYNIKKYGVKSINTLCLQPNESQTFFKTSQTPIFGSGTSVVNSKLFNTIKFNNAFEFGFGEDSDFGMQIRNLGEDVIFIPNMLITHLKAPIGGFRTKFKHPWEEHKIQPKPSPTVNLFNLKYLTKKQILGYKILLFIKYYRSQSIKNPVRYYKTFKKQWQTSIYWANKLIKDHA